ncbi:hypothetical protein RYX45_23075, partial [Alkalihalophilus pseudofirmus]
SSGQPLAAIPISQALLESTRTDPVSSDLSAHLSDLQAHLGAQAFDIDYFSEADSYGGLQAEFFDTSGNLDTTFDSFFENIQAEQG